MAPDPGRLKSERWRDLIIIGGGGMITNDKIQEKAHLGDKLKINCYLV